MEPRQVHAQQAHGVSRRALLQAGLAAGATLSVLPLCSPPALWGAEAGPPKRGGILRVRGWDPPHFDPHITRNFKTNTALSFVYNGLLTAFEKMDIRLCPCREPPQGGRSLRRTRMSFPCSCKSMAQSPATTSVSRR